MASIQQVIRKGFDIGQIEAACRKLLQYRHNLRFAGSDVGLSNYCADGKLPAPGMPPRISLLVNLQPCDKASPHAAVMLHLRARYVSKAAILTLPVRSGPAENRSSY
jgi:hypothetical protein